MSMTTTTGAAVLRPEQVGELVVQPVIQQSVALQVSTVVQTDSHDYRIPVVSADPTAGWFAEGAEITPSDATMGEVVVTPKKVAGLTIISVELADDSTPAAAQVVGAGIARDIARKVDAAFFGNTTTNGPKGLGSLTTSIADSGATLADLDAFAEAISAAELEGAELTAFVGNPVDVLALAKIKSGTGSNSPLLGLDATSAGQRRVLGVPLLSSSSVAAGTIWGIPQSRVFAVIRKNPTLEVDRSAFFTSDRVAVKATMRISFGFPHPLALVRLYDAV